MPRDRVLAVVDDCAAAGVKSLVVITAGFAEAGAEGRALQQAARRARPRLRHADGRPQLHGAAQHEPGAAAERVVLADLSAGRDTSALSSQSGALGLAILALAAERGVGLSTFVSVGNKADVSSNDLLEYWEDDAATRVILLYLESFGNPRRFARLARRIGRTKPIVAVKAGRTRGGSRAAGSHTAALAANDVAVDALFHQAGVIRADTIDEMFDIAACLDAQPLPAGRRVAIVTNAGGPGILAVDACESAGLTVPPFSTETRARLGAFLPPAASTGNPVDMVASAGPDEYRQAIEVALADKDTDALIVIFAPVDATAVSGDRRGDPRRHRRRAPRRRDREADSRVRDGRSGTAAAARRRRRAHSGLRVSGECGPRAREGRGLRGMAHAAAGTALGIRRRLSRGGARRSAAAPSRRAAKTG